MNTLEFKVRPSADRLGLKGPRAVEWLRGLGIEVPRVSNTWAISPLFVARLGTGEFFIEDEAAGTMLRGLLPAPDAHPPGVYPVLREDSAFLLSGDGSSDVLAQICNIDFSGLALQRQPVVMTSMIGVSVLVAPYAVLEGRCYRIWCDPTFGRYLQDTLGQIVIECGGDYTGVSR